MCKTNRSLSESPASHEKAKEQTHNNRVTKQNEHTSHDDADDDYDDDDDHDDNNDNHIFAGRTPR